MATESCLIPFAGREKATSACDLSKLLFRLLPMLLEISFPQLIPSVRCQPHLHATSYLALVSNHGKALFLFMEQDI